MARLIVDIGVQGNDGTGDSIRESFRKVNSNFTELYAIFGAGGTIKFTSLSDAPSSYGSSQVIMSNGTGTALTARTLVGGTGVTIDANSSNNTVTFSATSSLLINQSTPSLGESLNANLYTIGRLSDPSDALVTQFNAAYASLGVQTTLAQLPVTKGYADSHYVRALNGVVSSAFKSRAQPATPQTSDPDYDPTLTSNYVSTEVMQRKDVVYRGGDTMTGALTLSDHPAPLAGAGTPNGAGDLQAATKYYVDNNTYSSNINLFVSTTSGDDAQTKTPAGKQGRYWQYAYKTVGAAALQASNLIDLAGTEPGPYKQRIAWTSTTGQATQSFSTVQSVQLVGGNSAIAGYQDAADLLEANKAFIQNETIAYLNKKYVNTFVLDTVTYSNILGSILDGVGYDLVFNTTHNSSTVAATLFNTVNANIITNQLTQITDGINYANKIISTYSYSVTNTQNYIGAVIDALGYDLVFGSNYQCTQVALSFGSYNTGLTNAEIVAALTDMLNSITQLSTVSGSSTIINALQSSITLIDNIITLGTIPAVTFPSQTTSSTGQTNAKNLLLNNIQFIQAEIIAFLKSNYPNVIYNTDTCQRDVKYIVWSLVYDFMYGGNSQSIYAGLQYWRNSSLQIAGTEQTATVAAINYINTIAQAVITSTPPAIIYQTSFLQYTNTTLTGGAVVSSSISSNIASVASIVGSVSKPTPSVTLPTVPSSGSLADARTQFTAPAEKSALKSGATTYINSNGSFSIINNDAINTTINNLFNIITGVLTNGLASRTAPTYTSPSGADASINSARAAALANISFLAEEAYAWAINQYPSFVPADGVTYFKQHIQYLVEAVSYDVTYGGNLASSYAAAQYRINGASVFSPSELTIQTAAIGYLQNIIALVITNVTVSPTYQTGVVQTKNIAWGDSLTGGAPQANTINDLFNKMIAYIGSYTAIIPVVPSLTGYDTNALSARSILVANKTSIVTAVNSYLSATYKGGFSYNETTCYRDVGYIIDSMVIDILTGGNYQTVNAGKSYYKNASAKSIAIGTQLTETTDGIAFAKALGIQVLNQTTQTRFQNLYKQVFSSGTTIATTYTAVSNGTSITVTFASQASAPFTNDSIIYLAGFTPTKFNGLFTVSGCTASSVTVSSTISADTAITTGSVNPVSPSAGAINTFTSNMSTVLNIITNGLGAVPTATFGTGIYNINFDNGGNGYVDQGAPGDVHIIPAKILLGATSGAGGVIVKYLPNNLSGQDTIQVRLTRPGFFKVGEQLDFGETVKDLNITIFVESGIYYEDYPIRLPANVSIKGDEFRRTIMRPVDRVSLSPWRKIFFFRDSVIDANLIGLINYTTDYASSTTLTISGTNNTIVATLGSGQAQASWIGKVLVDNASPYPGQAVVTSISGNTMNCTVIYQFASKTTYSSGQWHLYGTYDYGRHYLSNPLDINSVALNNKLIDVLLCNDATRVSNMTFQGHGGFAMVLDPEGQVKTKSPYGQVCSSFSQSINAKRFAGGQFVDGFTGRLFGNVTNVTNSGITVTVTGGINSGLDVRAPQVPCVYYVQGNRYQVNDIISYTQNTDGSGNVISGTVVLTIDVSTPFNTATFYNTAAIGTSIPSFSGDMGNKIDALTYDLVFGSNYQTIKSGLFYLQPANQLAGIQQLFLQSGISQVASLMNSTTGTVLNGTNANSSVGTATITFAVQGSAPYAVGSSISVAGFSPSNFNGTFTVTNCTTTSVQYALAGTYTQSGLGTITAVVSTSSKSSISANALTVNNIIINGLQAVPALTFPIPSGTATNTSNAVAILIANKAFIRSEIVAWLASNYSTRAIFNYNAVTFSRNFGYFIDALTYDFLYGGNSSVVDNAQSYWVNGVSQILGQESYYTAALVRLGTIISQVVQNTTVTVSPGNLLSQVTNLSAATSTEATTLTGLNNILIDYVADGVFNGVANGTVRTAPTLPSGAGYNLSKNDRTLIQNNKTTIQSSAVTFLNSGANISINIEMGGNRSMLANDFAMINDLGYAIIATNGAASEQVSTFSYYCHTHYWSNNGGQIRSIGGSNAHGNYGMRASGYDVTELPNAVNLAYDMVQVARVYKQGLYASLMTPTANTQALAIYITGWEYIPPNNAELEIDHTASGGVITRYLVSTISHTVVTINGQNVLQVNLSTAGTNSTVTTGLAYALYDGQQVIIRVNQNIKFFNISNVKPTRPSTAVQYSDNLSDIYRIIAYNLTDSTGEPLPANTAILQADSSFNYYKFTIDTTNITQLDPADSTKTQGSKVGDNKIAVLQISQQSTIDQINKGIYITGWGGRVHRVISYTVPTFIATGLYSTYTAVGSVYTLVVTSVSGNILLGQILTGNGFNGTQTVSGVTLSGTSSITATVTLSAPPSGTPSGTITFGVASNGYITIDPNSVYNNSADGTAVNAMTYVSSAAGPTGTSYTAVTFNVPFRTALPVPDSYLTVSGQSNSSYNGTYQVLSVVNQTQITVSSIAGLSVGMVVTSLSSGAVVQPSTIIQSINSVNNTFIVSPACWLPYGATVTSTLVATLSGISITNSGTQYGSGIAPTITITGGGAINQAIATCTVANGSIATVTVVSPGYGYTSAPTITLSYGDGVLSPVLSSNPTTNDIINAGIITTQITLAYPTAPSSFTSGTTTSITGFNSLSGTGPYLASLNATLTNIPAAGTYYRVANNSNPLYNTYAQITGVYSTTASATSAVTNGVTLANVNNLTTTTPIQFTANNVQNTTLVATDSGGVLTLSSTTGLSQGRSIIFTSVTQSDYLTATTSTGNYLTLTTVSGLLAGEPIVFTSVTQTPTLTATTGVGGLLTVSSVTGLVVNQPIVFTAVTQNPTVVSTSSSDNSVTLSGTAGLSIGSSFIPTAVTTTNVTLTATNSTGNLATLSSTSALSQGESIVFTAVSQTVNLTSTATASATLTTGIVGNGTINASAGTVLTPTGTLVGTPAIGMVVTGGALTSTSNVYITAVNQAIFTATIGGTITVTSSTGSGAFVCSAAPYTLYAGMTVTVTGTIGGITWSGYTTGTVYVISTTNGSTGFTLTSTTGVAQTVSSGTPTGLTFTLNVLNVTNVASGTLSVGMLISGTSVTAGSYIVAFGSGAGGTGTYALNLTSSGSTPTTGTSYTVNASTLQTSTAITLTNNLVTVVSTAGMAVGESFVAASTVGGITGSTTYYISQLLANGTQLAVSATFGGANAPLSNYASTPVSITTGGSMGGVIAGTTYYIASIVTPGSGGTVTLSTSPTLSPVVTLNQTNSGSSGWTSVAGAILGGLTSGTTYYVVNINSPKVTLSTSPTLTPTVTLTNGAAGTSGWTSITNSIFGGVTSGTTYYIASINGNQITVSSSFGTGAISVTNGAGSWTGLAGSTLGGVTSGTTYYIKTINTGTNQITVTTDAAGSNVLSVSNSAGAWSGTGGSSFGGLSSGTTYYIAGINGNTITISSSSTLTPLVSTTQSTGGWTAVSGTILGGITSGQIYYVASINTGSSYIQLSTSPSLSPILSLNTASISASVNAGPTTGITLSYPNNPGTWGIQTTYLSSGSGTVTLSFATQVNSPGSGTSITISGFTPSGYNGTATITSVGTTSSTFVGYISGTQLTVTTLSTGTIVLGQIITSLSSTITANTYITGFVSGVNGSAGVYTINISQTVGNISSLVSLIGASSTISYTNATNSAVSVYGQFTSATSVTNESTNGSSTQLGIAKPFSTSTAATLRLGYPAAEGAQITTRISTCRATSHDFLNIGTGSYTTTNWPTVIYGNPAKSAQQSQEIVEEGVGRVFYVSTDQNGIFRVGRFFTVDQGTGSVTFSASIALSNLDGLGFKRGVVVSEFSTDSGMTNNATDTVSVQSAVRGYIDRRLGLDHGGSPVALTNLIGYGYLSLGGGLAMKASLNMAGYTISNVGTPTIGTDGANKSYVDAGLSTVGKLSTLTDAQISSLTNGQFLVYDATLAKWRNASATTGDVSLSFNSVTKLITATIGSGVITNSQVSTSAGIVQSKLALNAATTRTNATNITQADLGVASFDGSQFTITNGWVTHQTSTSAITGIPLSKLQYISNGTILGNLGSSFASPTTVTPAQIVTSAGAIISSNFTATGIMTVGYDGTNPANNTYSVTGITSAGGNGASSILKTGVSKEIDVGYLKISSYKALYLNNTTFTFTTPGGFDYMTATGSNATNTSIATYGTLDTSNGTLKSTLFTTGGSAATGQIIGNWQVQASSTWDVTLATLKSLTLDAGSETTAGTVRGNWSLIGASKLQATYADLAEFYEGDQEYEPGTVLVFGGDKEVTTSTIINDTRSAGVVTTNPAYVMNAEQTGIKVCIALAGRVPCKVVGRVKKGDMLTTSATPGYAVKALNPTLGAVIGKALEDKDYGEAGVIQVAVGRV